MWEQTANDRWSVRSERREMLLLEGTGCTQDVAAEPDLRGSFGSEDVGLVGRGEAVQVGEHFGLRITQIESKADRIKSLGK